MISTQMCIWLSVKFYIIECLTDTYTHKHKSKKKVKNILLMKISSNLYIFLYIVTISYFETLDICSAVVSPLGSVFAEAWNCSELSSRSVALCIERV